MKSYDLIRKYGWESLTWLSNLGVNLLADANIFFVDNGATYASDVSDAKHGNSFEFPFSTANYAVSKCTEHLGDVILLAPGHTETINDLGADGESGDETDELVLDKAGVTLLGIGSGLLRPTFTIGSDNTASSIAITAENVTVKNIIVKSGYADAAAGFTVADVDAVTIENCDIRDGNAANLELVIGISVAANADDIIIKNNTFSTWAGGGCANAISFLGGCDRAQIIGNTAFGKYSTGCLLTAAASYCIVIKDNVFVNAEAPIAIALHTSTEGILSGNHLGGATSTVAAVLTGDNMMWCFENYILDEYANSGLLNPTAVSS